MADKVVYTSNIFQTKNYSKFKRLPGNREANPRHVSFLKRKIEQIGNLTPDFPIIVNENLEVIDGQHRLAALQELELPVHYIIRPNMTIDSVITLNTGQKNWTWRDFAVSYSNRGNEEYRKFLQLAEETGETRFGILIFYATLGERYGHGRHNAKDTFYGGDFKMRDYEVSLKYLSQFQEMSEVSRINVREFAYSALRYMQRPSYNHELMIDRIAAFGGGLKSCYTVGDFYRELDSIYKAS